MKDFYLTLPSNSSMDYFPDNTLAKFITKLHAPLLLRDSWEVGLVEIIYPTSFYNVLAGSNILSHHAPGREPITASVPPGRYEDAASLLRAFGHAQGLPRNLGVKFEFNKMLGRVTANQPQPPFGVLEGVVVCVRQSW